MEYVSTRGKAPKLNFEEVLVTGLARDGGLYVPSEWPQFDAKYTRAFNRLTYPDIAERVMSPFIDGFGEQEFTGLVDAAYSEFDTPDVAPLRQLEENHWLMELFHGPTLAFKDVAMQLVGRMFDRLLQRRGRRITIVGATSGDTGSAAIEACRDKDTIDIFILYPHGRVSEIQRRQMTTVNADNVHCIAIEGTFDHCQNLLKDLFNDLPFRDQISLSAVNSINWGRMVAQIVYYFSAATALGAPDKSISFSVPTGNFGDIYAGYAARQMGLPIDKLVVATNQNDLLHRFFETGTYEPGQVIATQSPSMDIQVSSNFERLVFDMVGQNGATVEQLMTELEKGGRFTVGGPGLEIARDLFTSCTVDEATTTATIADVWREHGFLIDPHTAVGIHAARQCAGDSPMVTLATAHPAKFPEAVSKASGQSPALPEHMADLLRREERFQVLPADMTAVKQFILSARRD